VSRLGIEFVDTARRIADEVLFPIAGEVEARGEVPREHLDLLAAQGFYGLFVTVADDDLPDAYRAAEALASGCLSTALVWMQHHLAVRAVASSERPGIRESWLPRLSTGDIRAGAAVGGLRPGPPLLRSRAVDGGHLLDGTAPWVTGWGLVDLVHTAARDDNDVIVWSLIDARATGSLSVTSLDLLAVMASRTVELRFDRHFVPEDRVTGTLPYAQWPERDAAGLRGNGSLALGLADRCLGLINSTRTDTAAALAPGLIRGLVDELGGCRAALDEATPATLPAARAAASELAMRCATTLVTAVGARAVLAGSPANRLLREAAFLLVFGSRPAIKDELVRRLARPSSKD
jgi:alkylation response protein AidB-like acyl-CoA dehydrogenase